MLLFIQYILVREFYYFLACQWLLVHCPFNTKKLNHVSFGYPFELRFIDYQVLFYLNHHISFYYCLNLALINFVAKI